MLLLVVCRVLHLEAKSFQLLPLQFHVTTDDAVARDTFSVDLDSGRVTLLRALSYAIDPHQYQFNLSVTERYSNFVTHAPVQTRWYLHVIFSSAKEVMFLPVFVCLFVCLFVGVLAR